MPTQFKYFAFISYNSKDTAWGKKLQKKLEHYRMPSTLCSEHGWERTPIKPVFFAPTDIQPGGLTEELQERLRASKNLIVICSPNSAKSEWVGKEIEFFHSLGRTKNIHFFIVEGTPHSGNPDTECFNPVIDQLGLPEILGANIHEKIYRSPWLNKERAYAQLVSKLLGVEFDAIWQRHKRMLVRRAAAWTVGSIAILCALIAVWHNSQPFDMSIRLIEASYHNENLPPLQNAVVTIRMDNETKRDTIHFLDDELVFTNIPHRMLKQKAKFSLSCPNFIDIDTILPLDHNICLAIRRDEAVFGNIFFQLWDWHEETPIANAAIQIEGQEYHSDSLGIIELFIPLEKQQESYHIGSSLPLSYDVVTMPCFDGRIIPIQ